MIKSNENRTVNQTRIFTTEKLRFEEVTRNSVSSVVSDDIMSKEEFLKTTQVEIDINEPNIVQNICKYK